MLRLVLHIVEAASAQLEGADGIDIGIITGDLESESSRVELNVGLLAGFGSDVGDLRKIGGECVYIIEGKANLHARFLSASLHGRAAGDYDHQFGAEVGEDGLAGLSEAVAVGQKHYDRGDSPGHAQHGESGAAAVVAHCAVSFLQQVTEHIFYSLLLPQRFHGLQHRCFAGRIKSCDHTREGEAADGQNSRCGHQFWRIKASLPLLRPENRHEAGGECHADQPAE